METPISELMRFGLSARITGMFERRGVETVEGALQCHASELRALRDIGPKMVEELIEACRRWQTGEEVSPDMAIWCPTPEEIESECARIRNSWSSEERAKRAGQLRPPVLETQVVEDRRSQRREKTLI